MAASSLTDVNTLTFSSFCDNALMVFYYSLVILRCWMFSFLSMIVIVVAVVIVMRDVVVVVLHSAYLMHRKLVCCLFLQFTLQLALRCEQHRFSLCNNCNMPQV